jgi:hypothetical protein
MRKLAFLLFSISLVLISKAQNSSVFGSDLMALGLATTAYHHSQQHFANPAGTAQVSELTIGATYQNRYNIKEITSKGVYALLPIKNNVFGLSTTLFGYSLYQEQQFKLSYSKALNDKLSIGISSSGSIIQSQDSRSNISFSASAGFIYQLQKSIQLGLNINNIQNTFDDFQTNPTIVNFGLAFLSGDNVQILTALEQDFSKTLLFKAGVEYQPTKQVFLRAGVKSAPGQIYVGSSFLLGTLNIGTAFTMHPILGLNSEYTLSYAL